MIFPQQEIRVGDVQLRLRRLQRDDAAESLAPQTAALLRYLPTEMRGERKYKIHGVLAMGGMGAVLEAEDLATRRRVAMKVLLEARTDEDVARFIEEAQITAQLEHPNIVPIYELNVNELDKPFYVMKLVRGESLAQVLEGLREERPEILKRYGLEDLLGVFSGVCDALAYAHSKGVVHRDLKPDNVMLGEFGETVVMDWGLAKPLGQSAHGSALEASVRTMVKSLRQEDRQFRTEIGSAIGTPQYMSPEQASGRSHGVGRPFRYLLPRRAALRDPQLACARHGRRRAGDPGECRGGPHSAARGNPAPRTAQASLIRPVSGGPRRRRHEGAVTGSRGAVRHGEGTADGVAGLSAGRRRAAMVEGQIVDGPPPDRDDRSAGGGSSLDEGQEILVYLIFRRGDQRVGRPRIYFQGGVRDQLRRAVGVLDGHDLVDIAVQDQGRDVDLFQILARIGFGECLDGKVGRRETGQHLLIPTGVEQGLRDVCPGAVGSEIDDIQILEELGAVDRDPLPESIQHFQRCSGGIPGCLQNQGRTELIRTTLETRLVP
ncbi:MAG: serine/threonine-protein kinase [Chthoniobacter sp.]